MIKGKGVVKPYIQFLGNSAIDVTGSMYLVRFKKYIILLDCGLVQKNDIMTSYKENKEQLKKLKPTEIDYIILSHVHVDHSAMIPALYAKGCHAHIYVPMNSKKYLKLLWMDSMKIINSDCLKLQKKHGLRASPFYTENDIDKTLSRCIEIDFDTSFHINQDIEFEYYSAGHIIHAAQIYLTLHQDNQIKRIGFTGDIGGLTKRPYVDNRKDLPFCDVLIGENTYNVITRPNKIRDRDKDIEKIITVVQNSFRVLIPTFSLGRTQEILTILYELWSNNLLSHDIKIYLDSPLSEKICNLYNEFDEWDSIWHWDNLHIIQNWEESKILQWSGEKCIILSASGFLNGGRVLAHLQTILPNKNNHVLFVGYAGENNLASQIKNGNKKLFIDGTEVRNEANITELRSFSSHASYEELTDYYINQCRYNKLCLVHGNYEAKVEFASMLQTKLISQGISSRVICINQNQKVMI